MLAKACHSAQPVSKVNVAVCLRACDVSAAADILHAATRSFCTPSRLRSVKTLPKTPQPCAGTAAVGRMRARGPVLERPGCWQSQNCSGMGRKAAGFRYRGSLPTLAICTVALFLPSQCALAGADLEHLGRAASSERRAGEELEEVVEHHSEGAFSATHAPRCNVSC
eukprot:2578215-Rhodomonas_salina.2